MTPCNLLIFLHPPLQVGGVVTAMIAFFICLFDRSAEPDKLLPESRHIGLPSVDGGHGALRGQDQEQGLAERELGHPDRKSTSKRGAPKEPLQGFQEERGRGSPRPGLQCYRHRGSPGLCIPIHRWT